MIGRMIGDNMTRSAATRPVVCVERKEKEERWASRPWDVPALMEEEATNYAAGWNGRRNYNIKRNPAYTPRPGPGTRSPAGTSEPMTRL